MIVASSNPKKAKPTPSRDVWQPALTRVNARRPAAASPAPGGAGRGEGSGEFETTDAGSLQPIRRRMSASDCAKRPPWMLKAALPVKGEEERGLSPFGRERGGGR